MVGRRAGDHRHPCGGVTESMLCGFPCRRGCRGWVGGLLDALQAFVRHRRVFLFLFEDVGQQSAKAASRWGPLQANVSLDMSPWSWP